MTSRGHKRWRFCLVVIVVAAGITGLVIRLTQLAVFDRDFLQRQGNARSERQVSIPALRGNILDRNGYPLAITTTVSSLWVNPQQFAPTDAEYAKLAGLLGDNVATLKNRLSSNSHREFVYLKRHLSPKVKVQVEALKIPGVYFLREYKRFYPEGEVAAQLVGITNIDDQGAEGLELAYDSWLKGTPGKERVIKDGLGHVVSILNVSQEAHPGNDLTLSIDHRIQYLAYRELKKAVEDSHAQSGSVVVMDPHTGEVLAIANYPSYNPNMGRVGVDDDGRYRNRALTDLFEPGSTIKSFSITNALSQGTFTPDTKVDTSPGYFFVEGHRVEDEHNNGVIDLTTILQRSSNVGVTKVTLTTPDNSLWELLHKLGLGQITESGFPGEAAGNLPFHEHWARFTLATMSFGYGISVTNMQLAHAYSTLAAGGVEYPVSLLKLDTAPKGENIIDPAIARSVLTMLRSVAQKGGTARVAQIAGYDVAGKTGTVRIVGLKGYEKDHHVGIFQGVAPAGSPKLVVGVVIRDPQEKRFYDGYGGTVAAPVFKAVMGGSLRLLDVAPDKIADNSTALNPSSVKGN